VGGDGRLSTIAFGAGIATIALNVMAAMPTVALAWTQTAGSADPGLVRTVWNLNTLALVPIGSTAAMFTLAVALVILRTRLLPPWVGWFGLLSTVLSLASLFYLLADGVNVLLQTINIARFLTAIVFVLVVCV
jgi:hypothetical protein